MARNNFGPGYRTTREEWDRIMAKQESGERLLTQQEYLELREVESEANPKNYAAVQGRIHDKQSDEGPYEVRRNAKPGRMMNMEAMAAECEAKQPEATIPMMLDRLEKAIFEGMETVSELEQRMEPVTTPVMDGSGLNAVNPDPPVSSVNLRLRYLEERVRQITTGVRGITRRLDI